jgi:TonB family protein
LTSKSEQAVSSPLFSAPSGAGQINTGENTALGTRFAAYAAQIKALTTGNWRRQDIDRRVAVAPLVTIRFDILRNGGKAANVQLTKRSNIPSLDLSVQNAIEDTNYPPLPPDYEGNSVTITYTFELKR